MIKLEDFLKNELYRKLKWRTWIYEQKVKINSKIWLENFFCRTSDIDFSFEKIKLELYAVFNIG